MRTTYVLDTSTLIYDPVTYKHFPNSDVVIPIAVLNELDKLKKFSTEAGKNARVAVRLLDEISNLGDISTGIVLDNDVMLKVDATYIDLSQPLYHGLGDPTYGDTQILACAQLTRHTHPERNVVLVSNDINLRVKAKARGLEAEAYEGKKYSLSDFYSGVQAFVNEDAGLDLQRNGHVDPRCYGLQLAPNECVLFQADNGDVISMGRRVAPDRVKLVRKRYPWNISARNDEQSLLMDLIMDKNIDLVTAIGQAGTGKTLVALAAALELVINKREYDKLIVYRPIQPVGNDIGYLPGPQPLDAKIATPSGWKTMGEIQDGDFVIGSDGKPKKVLKIFPKGQKEVFRVSFSDNSWTECCEDHLWYTTTWKESQRKDRQGSVKSLKEIRETLKTYKSQINNHKISLVKPVEFIEQDLIIDPYIMGILLGDGTLSEEYSVYFTSSDKEIHDNCINLTPNDMLCKIKSKDNYNFIVKDNLNNTHRKNNIFAREIKKIGLCGSTSGTKYIPEKYKINSVKNRLALLQGLMDSDGFVSDDGTDVSYSTTSKQLAEDVYFIIQSLGGIAHINKKYSKYTYKGEEKEIFSYIVSVSLPDYMCPFKLKRKICRFKPRKYALHRMITDISSVGFKETKCILVESDDHLYATDQFILTHNTLEEKLAPWFQAIMDSFELLFGSKSSVDWKKELEMFQRKGRIELNAITYIRGRSIPNSIILVDEAQNLTSADIKTILTRAGDGTKIILTGDVEQIDNNNLDASDNGLTNTIQKFKDSELAGHITLVKGERSRLASLSAKLL